MRVLPITITADDSGHFNLSVGNGENIQHATGLAWDEFLGMVGVLTHPEIRSAPYGISKVRAAAGAKRGDAGSDATPCVPRRGEPWAPQSAEPALTLSLSIPAAERVAEEMADLLCWCRGFAAGAGPHGIEGPRGVDATSDFRMTLVSAICAATGRPDPADIPF
ncbi:hypothetical protein [Methylobacterium nodulans]|uniref:Uncharacterized protein n=1 Tax=Methylobacterium nodulans (strain LMG 21967 / CNCM I-2342 / ORS 2060) TaxID=460265 RepID=B8IIR4_METNO|nr:hypothetical protein [Methylobacterium nodulans]ACL59941.1 hypothetical protein Mnod_5095 [Methylobacterium nodulans ORS 2060]